MKDEGNPIQIVYKLIMNSGYGKSIMKAIESELKIKKNKIMPIRELKDGTDVNELWCYIDKNYHKIKSITPIAGSINTIVEVFKPIIEHFSRPQVGVEILSMSKRIMNEVMTTAEDNDMMIYYQDTDSMHISCENIPKLANIFREKYHRELIGKAMGQFHTDFDHHTAVNDADVYARNTIICGKKFYLDELVGLDKDNNEVVDYHIRMKGVCNQAILYECDKRNINPLQLYDLLYDGEEIEFDLLCGGTKPCFRFNSNYTIKSETKFIRTSRCILPE